jgi:triosephosphate isomerase
MRKKIVAGNWKMNLTPEQGESLVNDILKEKIELKYNQAVVVCPPFTGIAGVSKSIEENEKTKLSLGAQNISDKSSGAYTGEVSAEMLVSLNVRYVIVGHSERRQIFGETHELLQKKVDAVLASKMIPIFCCGEPLEIREKEGQNDYVKKQIEESLYHLNSETVSSNLVIAYEPIWAIGTGRTASADQAEDMHAYIRNLIDEKWGSEAAENISILYGGSVKPDNAEELFAKENVDGGLIGGAALQADSFLGIIEKMN